MAYTSFIIRAPGLQIIEFSVREVLVQRVLHVQAEETR